jgi:hypothetical protein
MTQQAAATDLTGEEVAGQVKTVVAELGSEAAERIGLDKMLVPFYDSLPYSPERYQQEITMLFSMECLLRYEGGRRLIVMWEHERTKCAKFAHFMEKFFPKIKRRRAYEAMAYARKVENCPQFRQFADSKGGWGKAMLLMDMASQEELEEFEKTGEILGITFDDLESKTLKQLQAKLRGIEAAHQKELTLAQAANSTLNNRVEELETALLAPDLAAAQKLVKAADGKVHEALQLLGKVDWDLVSRDWTVRLAVLQATNLIGNMVGEIEANILSQEMPEPPAKGHGDD